jgi:hypothetical protein
MKKQPNRKKPNTSRTAPKPRKSKQTPYDRVVAFPQAKGRTVELIELIADADYHCISIRFQDKTDLSVVIDPSLTFNANFSDWKTSNQRELKRWPAIRSRVAYQIP